MWWFSIFQNILISIIIIAIIHHLFIYFKETFTSSKTKDLVGFHETKYKNIINELKTKENTQDIFASDDSNIDTELLDFANSLVN
jgi:hypothetical protein